MQIAVAVRDAVRRIRGVSLGLDVVAGLTAAAVVIPKAMAYATVAGLPVFVGLYTAFVPMIVYALLGSSRVMIVSATTTLSILAATQLRAVVPDGDPGRLLVASATLACLVGLVLVVAGILRLGAIANFISAPVLTGFKSGVGLVIVVGQVPKLLGVQVEQGGFFHDLLLLAQSLPQTSIPTLLVGGLTIVALVAMRRLWPRSPAPLFAVIAATAASFAFGLQAHGVDTVGVVPGGLPSPILPDLTLVEQLLPGAAGIALMSFIESSAVGRTFAGAADPPVRVNRELLSTGLANLAGGFFGAMPAGGGTSQTAVVRALGGRSQLTSLVTAGTGGAVMLFLAPLVGPIPQATLAAVIVVYSVSLIQPTELIAIRRVRTMEFGWALTACLGVAVFGTLKGIVLAIVVSLLTLLARTARPRVSVLVRKPETDIFRPKSPDHPEDESIEGLLILRPEDVIYFANAEYLRERIQELVEEHDPRIVALDLSGVPDIEYSALEAIIAAESRSTEQGVELWLIGLNQEVLEVVRRSGLAGRLGCERMFFNTQQAVARYLATGSHRARVLVVVLVLTLLCQGCIGHRMYRPESVVVAPAYDLAFIELDAQGELWSPAQLTRALARIRQANATDEGTILLVFIHGWNHDAAEGDANVEGFRSWLASISAMEAMRAPAKPRRVVGVFIGWRGRSSPLQALSVFTFFARFAAAKRVASPATTHALYELMLTARANPRNTTVVAGHSFGGLILESALAQALIGSLGATFGSDRPEVDFPADLILLINPASQAVVAKQLVEIFERHHLKFIRENEGRRYEVPLVVSVTSNADTATRVFFPLGMQLRGFSKRFHDYGLELCGRGGQASYFLRTAGHQQILHSHRLAAEALRDEAPPGPLREVRLEYDPETRQEVFTASGERLRYRIRANPLSWNDTPYWIMSVPPEVLPDHARIFSREALELGAMLLRMSGALGDHRARLVRDDRVKPVLLAAGPDGGVRFLDRSRRIYAIDPTTSEAVFDSCVPRSLDEGQDLVGIAVTEQETWIVGSSGVRTAPESKRRMGIARFSPAGDGSWALKVKELPRGSLYEAAAFDLERQLVFLARRGTPSLEVADFARADIGPAPLVELGAAVPQITLLAYDAGTRHLFASDGLATLLAIDLDAAPARVQVVASGLDQPSALAFDGERRRLYVATSGDGALWKLECATECSAPVRFASAPALRRPRTLAVDAQGVVWAGDLENEVIVGFSPAGRLVQQVERLPSSF